MQPLNTLLILDKALANVSTQCIKHWDKYRANRNEQDYSMYYLLATERDYMTAEYDRICHKYFPWDDE